MLCQNNSTIFRTINTDAKRLTEQFGLLGKSFRDIKKDFANGLGVKNSLFQTSISKSDWQSLQKFNSAIKVTNDGLTKSQRITKAWNENMTGCSMAAKRMGNDLITGKQKIGDVSNSMKTATASTKALGVAMNVFANVGFMLAITAVTKVITELAQAQSKAVEAAQEATEAYKGELTSLEEYKTKVSELHEELNSENISYEESKTIREELLVLQDELIQKYGNEKTAIENITTAIKGEVDALDELNEKAYRDWVAKADETTFWNISGKSGLDQAIDYMETDQTVSFYDMQNANLSDEIQAIQKEIDETIRAKYGLEKQFATFKLTGTPEEIRKQLENIRQDYIDISENVFLREKLTGEWDKYREEAISSINEVLLKLDEGLGKHQETYQTYIEGMIKYDSEYSDEYANILQKRAELESAQSSGNQEEIQKAKQSFMDAINEGIASSSSNENVKKYFESLYPELQSEFSNWVFEFDLKANVKGLKDMAAEIGEQYTAVDLLDMVNTEGTQEGEDAFNSLIDKAIEYGVCTDNSAEEVQKLIDLLVELGIVQGNVQGSTSDNGITDLSTQLTNSKEALETFTSSVHSAFDAYSTLMNPNVSSADMLSSITQLSELAKTMGKDLNWEMLYGFGDTVTQLGSSIEYISEEYAKSVLSGAGIDSKFVDMLAHSIVQAKQAETQLSRLDSQIDSLQSSYTDLTDIIETYNSNGYITFDQLQKLLTLEPQYLACLVDENGQLSLNNESMRLLAEQRLNEAKAQIIQQAITELSELVTHKETTALADNITTRQEQLSKLSEYNTKMADAIAKTTVETELVRELNAELGNASSNGASEEGINQVLDNAYKKLKLVDKIGSTDLTKTLGGSSSKSAKDTTKTFDWIETLLSRIQRTITNLGKTVSATYRNWSTRNNALAQEMAEVNKEINAQMTAYNAYMEKANSIGLPDHYKNLVMNGGLKIEDIGNDALREQIESFKEYYEKALDASDAIEDLRANLADLAKTKFDNISKQYEDLISNTTHYTSMLEGFVSQSEVAGYMASEVYYQAMADKQQENITQLQDEYSSLLSAFDEAVKNSSIEKYSSDWYEMLSAINDVELELQDATTQLIEFNQTLQQLSWEVFDRIRESVNDITSEAEFLINVLDSKDLHTDKGVITDEGLAVQGLHAVNYNTYMEQAIAYAEEMRKIEAEMANDPYDMELVDRRNELLELQQEAISSAMSEKEAIHSLWEDGYNKMLESLQKVIDKRKELLNSQKD